MSLQRHIDPGREGLFNLVKSLPSTLKHEPGLIVADEDLVIVHGRFSGFGVPVNWIVDGASIILNASIVASKAPAPEWSVYNASKAAVRFARTWTTDLKDRRIRVNAVSPGFTDTP